MRPVTIELGPLVWLKGVLDRQRMQFQPLGQRLQIGRPGLEEIDPDGLFLAGGEPVRHLAQGQSFLRQPSAPVDTDAGRAGIGHSQVSVVVKVDRDKPILCTPAHAVEHKGGGDGEHTRGAGDRRGGAGSD